MSNVTVREKKINNGMISYYLDFYPPIIKNGKNTRREFLKLYAKEKPRTTQERTLKKETKLRADLIAQKRFNEVNKDNVYSDFERERLEKIEKGKTNFIEFYSSIAEKRQGNNYQNWKATQYYLTSFFGDYLEIKDLTVDLCEKYRSHLLTSIKKNSKTETLSINSASGYFAKFKATLKIAYKKDLISTDLNAKISAIKEEEVIKEWLTMEEVNTLAKTPFENNYIRRASLFSILTGLRYSDINTLTWDMVECNNFEKEEYRLKFRQEKTDNIEYMPISKQAFELLGKEKKGLDLVFEGKLKYSSHLSTKIKEWLNSAGIYKHITFHCFRHTYAVLQLEKGTPIYTVMKMMGHRDIKTTLRYAKIVDESKVFATKQIILDF